jgi:uncharacterized protein (DUF488 family)
MIIYTIGFTQKTAKQFFDMIREHSIKLLLDVRLNNKSQLAGFTKGEDLQYFLSQICDCEYEHCIEFAPTKEMLNAYKKEGGTWEEYVAQYTVLMAQRGACKGFAERFGGYKSICLLCSEPTPEHCHRRLLAEMITAETPGLQIRHL